MHHEQWKGDAAHGDLSEAEVAKKIGYLQSKV